MLIHQVGDRAKLGPECRDRGFVCGPVAKRYGKIPHPAFIAQPADGAAAGIALERLRGPGEQFQQRRIVQPVPGREYSVSLGRLAIMRADQLTVVATEYPVSHHGTQVLRDRGFVFDRKVGDTASSVELVGSVQGVRGTLLGTARTGPAVVFQGLVDRKRKVGIHLAKEEP